VADIEFPEGFTANASPALSDYVFIGKRKVLVSDLATLLATSGDLAPIPATWDRATLGGLATSQTLPAPHTEAGITGAALTLITMASNPGGNAIQIDAASSTPNGFSLYLWDDLVTPQDMHTEGYLYPGNVTAGDEWFVGFVFLSNDTGELLALMEGVDAAGVSKLLVARFQATSIDTIAYTTLATPGRSRLEMTASKAPGDPPAFNAVFEHVDYTGVTVKSLFTTDFVGAIGAWHADWDASLCNRVGLCVFSPGGAANPMSATVAGFDIRRGAA